MRSKRHRQEREEYIIKEQKKVDQGIFDRQTMIYLSKFYNSGIISKLDFILARGKEADVYAAEAGTAKITGGRPFAIVKFFRLETSSFIKMANYIVGDPRFSRQIGKSRKYIINTWCKKEFGNLNIANMAGVKAPKPYMANGNIIAMEFIGADGKASPELKDVELRNPEKTLEHILGDIRKLYSVQLVHADISEYNILIKGDVPYMIDFGQAVSVRHPASAGFLSRDIKNILDYFNKQYKISKDFSEVYKDIVNG